ncbi:MAG TPA: dephospho-CoA kinase [Anaerolineae bacterium]|nr:dephospho-CoA kinase [Anaerolineae bacterium]HQI87161.1 dephospho-CoA kinase [Anaerolineae bacterium]
MGNGEWQMANGESPNHQSPIPTPSSLLPTPPYRIGLTGNIATGKSTVGRMLAELGAEVIDADRLTHSVLAVDGAAYPHVVAAFGADILAPDGTIDRGKLGAIVFSDAEALAQLERLVHPPVIAEVRRRVAASLAPVVVIEAIKLLESGVADDYDAIWVTTCPETEQVKRLMKSRHLTCEEALRRIHAQPPQAEKLARADVIIDTRGSLAETHTQVIAAWETIKMSTD